MTISDNRFSETVAPGCGNANHLNEGAVARRDNRLTLTTTATTRGWPLETRGFVLVAWGEWLYLVEADRAKDFCNAINTGSVPVGDVMIGNPSFYQREGDESRAAPTPDSLPDLLPEWNDFIVRSRLRAATHIVEGDGNAAVIDLGTKDGVFEGLEFVVRSVPVDAALFGSDRVDRIATVKRVELNRSHIEYRNYRQPIPAGLTVETGMRFKPSTLK